ncbi:hypothetical protein [Rhodovulum sp. ES.010]|uniref:hypothetical protein n=1 Tax=Rhodovulum sp. ES.010 TaxID=1882821 RepID=UPI0015881B9A|nr:hypothetical protein [Rhodovulum sp. ES.010]
MMLNLFRTAAITAGGVVVMAGGAVVVGASSAHAATIKTVDYGPSTPPANDCAGVFGESFDACVAPDGSPVIAKWDVDEDKWEINSAFGDVTSSMFTVSYDSGTDSSGT